MAAAEGTFGYNPAVRPPAYDPEGAKKLLAEAGFPQGFRLTLHSPNDRYPNDSKAAQAVAQMWSRVGIRTEVEAVPWASFAQRSNRQEYAIRLSGWGSVTGEASYALVNILGTFDREKRTGASNAGRYTNPALDALTERAAATIDDPTREALLREAVKMAMDDVGHHPDVPAGEQLGAAARAALRGADGRADHGDGGADGAIRRAGRRENTVSPAFLPYSSGSPAPPAGWRFPSPWRSPAASPPAARRTGPAARRSGRRRAPAGRRGGPSAGRSSRR